MPTGFGLAPFGTAPWGFGTPDIADSSSAAVLKKLDGTQGAVPLIDPDTRDYVLDDTGQKVGDDAVPQMVQFALYTKFRSSAVADFGLDLSKLDIYTAASQRIADVAARACLKHLTDKRWVSVQRTSLTKVSGIDGAVLRVEWVDLTAAARGVNTTELPFGS